MRKARSTPSGLFNIEYVRQTTTKALSTVCGSCNKREDPTPFCNEYRAERDRETDLGLALRAEIERLRDVQEKLNTAYNDVFEPTDRAEFRKALSRLRRVLKSTEKALGPEVMARAPKHD